MTHRIGDRDPEATRIGSDYTVEIRPWGVEIQYRRRTEARFDVNDRSSVDRGATATAIGLAILRAVERCSQ